MLSITRKTASLMIVDDVYIYTLNLETDQKC